MSVTVLVHPEETFSKLSKPPVIANNFDISTVGQKQKFDSIMFTQYEGDSLKPFPSCSCGHLKGMFKLGDICEICGGEVTQNFSKFIESEIWLLPLPTTKAFITPIMWYMMKKLMLLDGVDCLEYLTNPYYRSTKNNPSRLTYVLEQGHSRGLNYFYDNFDKIIHDFVYAGGKYTIPEKLSTLTRLVEYNRDKVFTSVLPIPNKVMFPIEKSGNVAYGDRSMIDIVNAVRIIQESESRKDSLSVKQMEARMVKCISLISNFHYNYVKETTGGKHGAARQHMFGGRWHSSSRAVITSIFEPHDFREVWFPWGVAVRQFRMQITNKLIRRGYGLKEIYDILRRYATTYDDELYDILKELIEESPFIGIPIILQRNPTIRRASALMLYVTRIKTDTKDNTISLSVGNLTGFNAD